MANEFWPNWLIAVLEFAQILGGQKIKSNEMKIDQLRFLGEKSK